MSCQKPGILRVGIDTGGTFTDICWDIDGKRHAAKVPSRPDSPVEAVLDGIGKVPSDIGLVCHGTTVGTNAILSRHGGPARMVVTRGFRDVPEIGRGERENLYSPSPSRPKPLIGRDEIYEINLRLAADGTVISSPDEPEIAELINILIKDKIESVGVGILHSAAYPDHEFELADKIRKLSGIRTFPSAKLSAYPREFERWSLASIAAYLAPVLGKYLADLAARCPAVLALMASSGILVSPDQVIGNPALCILSGPAGGAIAAMSLGLDRVLALDMGGTSTDVTLIAGKLPRTREASIDGLPVPLPTIDIHTIGAGGGSIVKIDTGGMLTLGPESAGASPGPACYGNGGPAALTDVALLSGRLVPQYFMGGTMNLNIGASRVALEKICPKNLSADCLIDGVIDLAITHLTGALRKISVSRGIDPTSDTAPYTLVPFGGAGAFFAVECAREIGLREVLHPRAAGVFSAIGLTQAPMASEMEKAIIRPLGSSIGLMKSFCDELEKEITGILGKWNSIDRPIFFTTLECRYSGQTYTLEIAMSDNIDAAFIKSLFEAEYIKRYSYLHTGSEIEIVAIRVRGELPAPKIEFEDIGNENRSHEDMAVGSTKLRLHGAWIDAPVYHRGRIPIDENISGPCLVVEDFATLYLPDDTLFHLDRKGHAHISI